MTPDVSNISKKNLKIFQKILSPIISGFFVAFE